MEKRVSEAEKKKTLSTEQILNKLRARGCRITRQRKIIVEIILKNNFMSCKDIYYQVIHEDSSIGMATVYRMIRQLEDIDVLVRVDRIELKLP